MDKKGCMKKGCGCAVALILIIGIVIAIVGYIFKPKWHDDYGQRFQDIAYGERQHNTYDLFLPSNTADIDSLALILYVHGGSWLGGDKTDHLRDCYKWVQKGYATATMNYSLLNEENVSLQTMLDEITSCIENIMQFAAEKNAPIRQMAIAGTSAGGHLAMMFAYSRQHPLPIRFEAIKVGPADFRILFPYDKNSKPQDVQNFIFSCTGQRTQVTSLTEEQADSIKLIASPINYINDSTALPAIWAYGEKDSLIKPAHYRALKASYDSLGRAYDLIVYPNSNHILMHDKDCSERYDSTLNAYCEQYFGY